MKRLYLCLTLAAALAASGTSALAQDAAAASALESHGVPEYVATPCTNTLGAFTDAGRQEDSYSQTMDCLQAITRQVADQSRPLAQNVCYYDGKAYSEGAKLNNQRCVRNQTPINGNAYYWGPAN